MSFWKKEEEVILLNVAENPEKLVANLDIKSDINKVIIQLKDILLDIYKIINEDKKICTKIENGIKVNRIKDDNIKKEVEQIKDINIEENITQYPKDNNDNDPNKVVGIDKENKK